MTPLLVEGLGWANTLTCAPNNNSCVANQIAGKVWISYRLHIHEQQQTRECSTLRRKASSVLSVLLRSQSNFRSFLAEMFCGFAQLACLPTVFACLLPSATDRRTIDRPCAWISCSHSKSAFFCARHFLASRHACLRPQLYAIIFIPCRIIAFHVDRSMY